MGHNPFPNSNLDPDYHDHAARGECEEHGKPIAEGHDHRAVQALSEAATPGPWKRPRADVIPRWAVALGAEKRWVYANDPADRPPSSWPSSTPTVPGR
jgi:hypothetical protein